MTNTQAFLAPLSPFRHPLAVTPDGLFQDQRTELPTGEAIGKRGTKDTHHHLPNKSGEDAFTNLRAIPFLPPPLAPPPPSFLIAPNRPFRGRRTKLPEGGAIGEGGPSILHTTKMLPLPLQQADKDALTNKQAVQPHFTSQPPRSLSTPE